MLHHYWAQPSLLPRIAGEKRLVLSGVSASEHHGLDILPSGELEGYVPEAELPRVVERYALAKFVRKPNLTLHALPFWPFRQGVKFAPLLLALLDMAESEDERTRAVGREGLSRYPITHLLPAGALPPDEGDA
jgi:hypothetical protein